MTAGHAEAQANTGWYRYDIASQQWHRLARLPQGLGYTLLTSDDNKAIFMLGGSTDAGQMQQSTQIYRYNIAEDSWLLLTAALPGPLSGAASCTMRSREQMIVIGGYGNTPLSAP